MNKKKPSKKKSKPKDSTEPVKKKFRGGKVTTKPGHSLLARQGRPPEWNDPVRTTIYLEREVIEGAKKLFPGQVSMLCNLFLVEVIKKRPRVIFDTPFPRAQEVGNPFQKPSLILQCHRRNGTVLRKFDTVFAAHAATGVPPSLITRTCNGLQKTAGKFQWRYDDEIVPWVQ
jgi:hypothetical protein